MKNMKNKLLILMSFLLCIGLFFQVNAYAAFSLSVTPYEGGSDLRFGKIDPSFGQVNKELSVRITTDIGKQYRLVQNVLDPLSTTEGNTLPRNSFLVYGIRGTNRGGTLNITQEIPVNLSRQIIYTSTQNGAEDSFTLVYSLMLPADVAPGSYRGRISFSLETVDASQSPVIVILNIFAEVEVQSAIQINTAAGSKNIILKATNQNPDTATVVFNIIGGLGRQFRINQVVMEQPVSSDNQQLDWSVINFSGQGAQKGMVVNQPVDLSDRQQIIYTSSPRGDPDSFTVTYNLGDLSKQKSGTYRTKIKYILESGDAAQNRLIDTLWLELDNPRVFELLVTPQLGGSIQFKDLKPLAPPKTQEVIFEIKTNLGKQYQVTQYTSSPLTNKEGKKLPPENFTIKETGLDINGKGFTGNLKFSQKTQVREGQVILFVSDKLGSPSKFSAIYELSLPRDIYPGDYTTNFSYTVNEI